MRNKVLGALIVFFVKASEALAAETSGSGYLQYQEPVSNGSSTITYVLALIFVFIVVCALAWLATRIFARQSLGMRNAGADKIVSVINIAPNRSLMVVDALDRILFLGVCEHSINLLVEVSDLQEVVKLRERYADQKDDDRFGGMLGRQLGALRGMARRYGGGNVN